MVRIYGHIVDLANGTISPDKDKLEALRSKPVPLGATIQVGLDGIVVPTSNVVKPIGDDYPAEVAREADLDVPVREAHVS